MKIAFVVQRYGLDICGGAELHCRMAAEHLSKYYNVEVLTTCAKNYVTWRNEYSEGKETINGISVRRFPVAKERNNRAFGWISRRIFRFFHTERAELKWLELQGPYSPALLDFLEKNKEQYDFFIFFSYRYWLSYHGVTRFPDKSLLVPTAEHDPTIYLKIFKPFFHKPRAIIYNSFEEKELINKVSSNHNVLAETVGIGINLPEKYKDNNFKRRYNITGDYVIYIGRIDPNKGCREMFKYFLKYFRNSSRHLKLVLIGEKMLPVPKHKNIISLGFVSAEDKFNALMASLFMIMPSQYESLSMVVLEAWFLGKPVLVNGQCEVLKGQCKRSNGGLYYHNYAEFEACMNYMLRNSSEMEQLGKQGNKYVEENYSWETIEKKYINLIETLQGAK